MRFPTACRSPSYDREALPQGWQEDPPPASLRDLGTHWLLSKVSAVARVPSAIVPTEYNYLPNPEHPDFGVITMAEPIPFVFDQRMWRPRKL
jgi:RES domain-containing protein